MSKTKPKPIVFFSILLLIFLTSCSTSQISEQTATPLPEPTQKPKALATLEAREPDYVIHFDGESCKVEGPVDVKRGEYMFVLNNHTDLPATLWVAPYQSEGSFAEHFKWREENCGSQGSHCEDEEGDSISYPFIGWTNAISQAQEGTNVYYKVYDLEISREHLIYVSSDGWWGWLCAPIQVD